MKTYNLLIVVFLSIIRLGNSQQTEPNPDVVNNTEKLTISDFSYPLFLNGEQHGSFLAAYQISDKTLIELQGFYDTYLMSNRFRTAAMFKRYVTQRLYAFGGLEVEFANNKGITPPLPPRIGSVMGFGYDVIEGFQVEGKFNYQLNNSPMGAYGEPFIPMPQVYTLGGKFKF